MIMFVVNDAERLRSVFTRPRKGPRNVDSFHVHEGCEFSTATVFLDPRHAG